MNRHRRGHWEEQQRRMMQDLHDEAEQEFFRRHGREFMRPEKKGPRKSKPSLRNLRNVKWNPYDKTLQANFKDYRADAPPEEEE